ncbi:MAG: hypothetical protein AAGM84_11375 [Pseudomonadota bacterium]
MNLRGPAKKALTEMPSLNPDRLLGLLFVAVSVAVLVLWVPNDIETGLIEKVRRQVRIGDSMMPVLSLAFVIFGAVLCLFAPQRDAPQLTLAHVRYLFALGLVLAASLLVMRWAGPFAVDLFGAEDTYRNLRDERPWKYLGFVLGGTGLVAGIMTVMEGRFSGRTVLVGFVASVCLIALYDLPFDDLLLPPNGDV